MADNKRPFPRTVLVGNGLLLLCALTGFTGSFLSLYGDPGAGGSKATALDRLPERLCLPDGPVYRVHITPEGGDGDGG